MQICEITFDSISGLSFDNHDFYDSFNDITFKAVDELLWFWKGKSVLSNYR